MSDESPLDLGIYLRRVNPKVVHKLRVSLTDQEWECLIKVIARALEDVDFYMELCAAPGKVLKEEYDEFSDEAIEGLKTIRGELPQPGAPDRLPFPPPTLITENMNELDEPDHTETAID